MYASQQHEQFLPDGTRAGFLIGDGAGVGKGRTIAGKKKSKLICEEMFSLFLLDFEEVRKCNVPDFA